MATPIRFRCHGCRAQIKAPWELLGHQRCCPGCGCRLVVRPQAPADVGPMLLREPTPGLVWHWRPRAS
jgi:hypothetical protein